MFIKGSVRKHIKYVITFYLKILYILYNYSICFQNVVGRFNERFLLSLASCKRCLVVDDQLNVLPLSSHNLKVEAVQKLPSSEEQPELNALKESLQDTQPISSLVNCCKTIDQVRYIKCVELMILYVLNSCH